MSSNHFLELVFEYIPLIFEFAQKLFLSLRVEQLLILLKMFYFGFQFVLFICKGNIFVFKCFFFVQNLVQNTATNQILMSKPGASLLISCGHQIETDVS
jgi:hypothetical protein